MRDNRLPACLLLAILLPALSARAQTGDAPPDAELLEFLGLFAQSDARTDEDMLDLALDAVEDENKPAAAAPTPAEENTAHEKN